MLRRRKRIVKKIRRSGIWFGITTILVFLGAWNTGENLLYIIFGGLAAFLILSWSFPAWMLRGINVTREGPEAVHRGEPFAVHVRLERRGRLLPAVSIRLDSASHLDRSAGYVATIPPRYAAVFNLTESFSRRGVFPLPKLELVSAFPFGFIEYRRTVEDNAEVVVYPRVWAVRTVHFERLCGEGEIPKVVQGDGDEFFCLRDYRPGDDIRRIAWRASARRDQLLVKEVEDDTSRLVTLIFDPVWHDDLANFDDSFEEAIELVASLAVSLLNRHYSVGVVAGHVSVPLGEGTAHAIKILDLLARITPNKDPAARGPTLAPQAPNGAYLYISPDPKQWGRVGERSQGQAIDPREVVRA